jgi:hypothetical protein
MYQRGSVEADIEVGNSNWKRKIFRQKISKNIVAERGIKKNTEKYRKAYYIRLSIVACRAVTTQRPHDKQIYQSRF